MLIHWNLNNDICEWTRQIKTKCDIKEHLRTFIRIFFPNFKDKGRKIQKTYLIFGLIISFIKLIRFNQ